jgi:hypothetical protein
MVETPKAKEKLYPSRCQERVRSVELRSDIPPATHRIGSSLRLEVGQGDGPDKKVLAMALHPAGVFFKTQGRPPMIIPLSCVRVIELVEED